MDDNEVMSYRDLKVGNISKLKLKLAEPTVYILSTQKGKTGRGLREEHAKVA